MTQESRGPPSFKPIIGWIVLGILLWIVVVPLMWAIWWSLELGSIGVFGVVGDWSFREILEMIFVEYKRFYYNVLTGNLQLL